MDEQKKLSAVLGIPVSELEIMVSTYHEHCKLHPDYAKHPHVKCVWFPIDRILDICKRLKDENADGLRIYFGRYPADVSAFENPKPLYPNTNSIIFVSTGKDANGNGQTDYFTEVHPIVPENRGEQCQPTCPGVTIDLPN